MQSQQLSSTPFGSSNVTSATVDNLIMRVTILEDKMNKLDNTLNVQTTTQVNTDSTVSSAPTVAQSIIPPTQTTPDLTSIFPKTGGRRKKTLRRKKQRT